MAVSYLTRVFSGRWGSDRIILVKVRKLGWSRSCTLIDNPQATESGTNIDLPSPRDMVVVLTLSR